MVCQYCRKRLPLFRKLKDGEFCSSAHREMFLAQRDQSGLAALQEQRERSNRVREAPVAPARVRPERPAAPDAAFCDRYFGPQVSAMRLGQLAAMPLRPAAMAVQVLFPDRPLGPYRAASVATWTPGTLPYEPAEPSAWVPAGSPALPHETLPAPHVLSLLSSLGAPASLRAEHVDLVRREALWNFGSSELALLNRKLATEWEAVETAPVASLEAPPAAPATAAVPAAEPTAEAAPLAGAIACPPALAFVGSDTPLPVARPSHLGFPSGIQARRRDTNLVQGHFAPTGLTPLSAAAVSRHEHLSLAGAPVLRFPNLIPTRASRPTRRRSALALAVPSNCGLAFPARNLNEAVAGAAPLAVSTVSSARSLARALVALSNRLQITGVLLDLLAPSSELASPCRIFWRHEAQSIAAVRTLAVRPLPMEHARADGSPVWPARPRTTAGPKRADRLVRLNSIIWPAQIEFTPGTESVSFHLEPRVIQPRLTAQPDRARQGLKKGSQRKQQADSSASSLKIPILRRFWVHAPADIRWVALIIPLVFFLAWYSWTPDGKALNQQGASADLAVDTSGVQAVLASFKSRISNRAAIELSEDFRAGLSEWQGSREDWASNWSYDQAGFVRPGSLALLTPSRALSDYTFEFMGQIENRSLNWVYRAKDTRNYYLSRLVITRNGPVPEVALVRSVVKNGHESHRKQIILPMNLRADTLYRVRVEVNGSDFTTSVLGQVVDTFTDTTHSQGGIGFYGGSGEASRIRWVELSHQYDTLGRLCAMLVPYGVGSATAQAKTITP